jgi:hypothetical protein
MDKIFCGNGKVINTQYGEMTKISFSKKDLETMLNNLTNGWVNTVLKEKKNKVEGKPTHYLEVDNWVPTNSEKKEMRTEEEIDDTLPF